MNPPPQAGEGLDLLVVLAAPPGSPHLRDGLDTALAAAALDMGVEVALVGDACGLTEADPLWRTLDNLDLFGLRGLWRLGDAGPAHPAPKNCAPLDRDGWHRLLDEAPRLLWFGP